MSLFFWDFGGGELVFWCPLVLGCSCFFIAFTSLYFIHNITMDNRETYSTSQPYPYSYPTTQTHTYNPQPTPYNPPSSSLSPNEVSRIVGVPVKGGETIKGESRITYMPYEKKITEYENRQYVEHVPVKRKVIQYEERRIVEEVPREVVTTDYYAVENITQYYKEVVPEKKIQMVPVERKVKRVEYMPVEKQIVHYPQGQDLDYAKGQSRVILQNQGVAVRPDAVYRPIDPQLIYKYSTDHSNNPVGYIENGAKRYLSNTSVPLGLGSYNGSSQVKEYTYEPVQHSYRTIQDINIYPN